MLSCCIAILVSHCLAICSVTLDEGKVRQKRQLERKKKRDEEQRLRDEEQQQLQAKMMEGQSKEQDKFKVVFLPSQDLNRVSVTPLVKRICRW